MVVFENRFPAFTCPGRCEVVCFTADHTASFASLSPAWARLVVGVWAERTAELGGAAGVAYGYPFENPRRGDRGDAAASARPDVLLPASCRRGSSASWRSPPNGWPPPGGTPSRGVLTGGARVLHRGGRWTTAVGAGPPRCPPRPRWPVQVQVQLVPHRRLPDLAALDGAERDELAVRHLDMLGRLDRIHAMPMPYVVGGSRLRRRAVAAIWPGCA